MFPGSDGVGVLIFDRDGTLADSAHELHRAGPCPGRRPRDPRPAWRTPLTSIRTNIELLIQVERHPELAHRLPPEDRTRLFHDLDALTTAGAAVSPAAAAILIYRVLSCWAILSTGLICWATQIRPQTLEAR